MTNKGILKLLAKKYVFEILTALEEMPRRFKDLLTACEGEKMRTQRLRELENIKLIFVRVERVGRRPVSIYNISKRGREALRLIKEIKKII